MVMLKVRMMGMSTRLVEVTVLIKMMVVMAAVLAELKERLRRLSIHPMTMSYFNLVRNDRALVICEILR